MTLIHAVAHPGGDGATEPDRLPTLIALHGYGANAQDLLGLHPHLAGGRLLMICPQAPIQVEPGFHGFSWNRLSSPGGASDPAAIEGAADLVRDFVDFALDAYPADPERVVLLGFSQGGSMAYRCAFREPARFAGLAALSTRLPPEVFADEPPSAAAAALPLLIQHGAADPTVGADGGRAARDRLQSLGLAPDYHEYPMGHEIGAASAGDLSVWLERVLLDGAGSADDSQR